MGPTATGKSELALAVAQALGDVEIVAVDSMQVYRGMDIGTAKPSAADRRCVPHHLLDLADPGEDYSVARFAAAAADALADIESRGRRALLVGGTGLYLQAVIDGLELPGRYPEVRSRLEAEADGPGGVEALHRRLSELDPVAAARMNPSNRRRVLRALEVVEGSGRAFSSFGPGIGAHPPTAFSLAGVWLRREVVARRIVARYHHQVEAGFVDEVRELATRPMSATAGQALGYRELLAHLAGEMSLAEAVETAIGRTRSFARRQRMWFRRDPRITWMGAGENPLAILPALLGHWARP